MLYYSIPIILAILISPGFAFGETEMDTDPFTVGSQFDSKPLDEAEQDMEDLTAVSYTHLTLPTNREV